MNLTRRGLVGTGASLAAAAVAGVRSAPYAGASVARVATVAHTLRRGTPGAKGYAKLVRLGGESHQVRTDLGVKAAPGRAKRRTPLIAFAQLSDVHIVDAQSPLRVEWLDRFDDPSQLPSTGIFTSAYRPHEMLSAQVADAMVREINEIVRGPVTGLKLALAVQTGDNSDNSQYNEVRWNIDVLDGERVRIDSGDLSTYEGVCDDDPTYYDRAYWHPHGPPPGKRPDGAMTNFGFPRVRGLLDAARRPFRPQGLAMPWYTAFGNHDGLVQGNFPADTLQLNAIATGPVKIISPPAGVAPADIANALADGDLAGLIDSLAASPGARRVTPDPDRRLIARAAIVEEHFTTSGKPEGHGFRKRNRRDGTAYYAFDQGRCRFVVLDTVNPNGYADGSIDQTQFEWLTKVIKHSTGKYVMVFSHHTSSTMGNPLVGTGGDVEPRVLGPQVLQLLLDHQKVLAWINGHTHRNEITAHKRGEHGGLWEINTASHIDWPQQSRLIELCDNHDGSLSIFTTMVDHAGPRSYGGHLGNSTHLAGLARELAANDWHNRSDENLGKRTDRNCELIVRNPPLDR